MMREGLGFIVIGGVGEEGAQEGQKQSEAR